MTQKKSSKEEIEAKVEEETKVEEPEIEVTVEGEPDAKEKVELETPKQDEDIEALRKQISDLEAAQDLSRQQASDARRQAQEAAMQVNNFRQSAEQSQYDSIVTALGAAQMEVDSAKRDIILAGSAQDFPALADAQERLAAAKAHMIGLEQGKNSYEEQSQQRKAPVDPIEANTGLSYEEKSWLRSHPEAMSDPRKNAKLNAAYFDAMDKGLTRGSNEYFNFIEEQLGYKKAKEIVPEHEAEDNPVMVAAPPSRDVPQGAGRKTTYTLTREEAEIAKLSGITPQEYVKQREVFRGNKKAHPDDYPER